MKFNFFSMNISKDSVVSLTYQLTVDGNVIETVTAERPMEFIFGAGYLLPKFEENVSGLKVGDKFSFDLTSEDAYGPKVDEAIVELPKNIFEVDGQIDPELLTLGNQVPMMDGEGHRMMGTVVEVKEEVVVMDFNHMLAGADLSFAGEVVGVREATEEELTHGHVHAAGGCGDCGCDGDCSTDEGCGSGCGCE